VADQMYVQSEIELAARAGAMIVFDEVDRPCGAICRHDGHCVLNPGHSGAHCSGFCTWPQMQVVLVWKPGQS